jgi:hypothetical protein
MVQFAWLLAIILAVPIASAQEALQNINAIQAAADAQDQNVHSESLPYTFKTGDFRLLLSPALGFDWNDNVYLTRDNAQDDFIIRPLLGLNASYLVTEKNLLQLNASIGYDKYANHDDLSRLRVNTGTALSFDLFIRDIWINLHDRIHYFQDSATEAAIANTGSYGSFENTIGLAATRQLRTMVFSLGYDHQNYLSTSSVYDYRTYASEMVFGRAGFLIHPQLTAGLEGTAAFTSYDEKVLNDNDAYSAGLYADWKPSKYLSVQPRFGYTIYDFRKTSLVVPAQDLDTWYVGLSVRHAITEAISYNINAGHELRLGIESDLIDDWYFRPNAFWQFAKNFTLSANLNYEHGKLSGSKIIGITEENYDYFGGGLSLAYYILNNATISLQYRVTFRASDVATREYAQNLVGLLITYNPK